MKRTRTPETTTTSPLKIISIMQGKGGVAKTSTTLSLAWAFLELGKKVLVVDADGQMNATQRLLERMLPPHCDDDVVQFLEDKKIATFYDFVYTVHETSHAPKTYSVLPVTSTGHDSLFLLPGDIRVVNLDGILDVTRVMHSSFPAMRNTLNAVSHVLVGAAEACGADVVLVDTNPNLGALNSHIWFASHGFVIPATYDPACVRGTAYLSARTEEWTEGQQMFRCLRDVMCNPNLNVKWPQHVNNIAAMPKFLGLVLSDLHGADKEHRVKYTKKHIEVVSEHFDFGVTRGNAVLFATPQYPTDLLELARNTQCPTPFVRGRSDLKDPIVNAVKTLFVE